MAMRWPFSVFLGHARRHARRRSGRRAAAEKGAKTAGAIDILQIVHIGTLLPRYCTLLPAASCFSCLSISTCTLRDTHASCNRARHRTKVAVSASVPKSDGHHLQRRTVRVSLASFAVSHIRTLTPPLFRFVRLLAPVSATGCGLSPKDRRGQWHDVLWDCTRRPGQLGQRITHTNGEGAEVAASFCLLVFFFLSLPFLLSAM